MTERIWRPRQVALAIVCGLALYAPSQASALNKERSYEMVSPIYKAGYGIHDIDAVAPNGERVAFISKGAFAGETSSSLYAANAYVARRLTEGWSTVSLMPPSALTPASRLEDFTPTLDASIASAYLAPNAETGETQKNTGGEFLRHNVNTESEAGFEQVGVILKTVEQTGVSRDSVSGFLYRGASPDLSHIVFEGGPLLQEASRAVGAIYDMTTRGDTAPSLRLVAVKNTANGQSSGMINTECVAGLGEGSYGKGSQFNAIADDGEELFFTVNTEPVTPSCPDGAHQLFVRVGGERTLEVSKPLAEICAEPREVPCRPGAASRSGAEYAGASEDGSKVFFTTAAPLEPTSDKDDSTDLYMARIGCPGNEENCSSATRQVTQLVQISHGAEPAGVEGVVAIAPDGSHIYFVARGVLGDGSNMAGQTPSKGADNLYVYDSVSEGQPTFITDLCSGPSASGTVRDLRCPTDLGEKTESRTLQRNDVPLWQSFVPEAQTAGGGRFLVFSSYGQLTMDDRDNARDIYRYDAVTGALIRVSIGEGSYDANGNRDDGAVESEGKAEPGTEGDAQISASDLSEAAKVKVGRDMRSRAITEDGSRIVFTSSEPLSRTATNGLDNAYEWHVGHVSLVSSGSANAPVSEVVITPSGHDIFFKTTASLVPQDRDGAADVYDARIEGGFPAIPAPRQPCSGDACQGPLTSPASLLVPGSVTQASGENVAPLVKQSKDRHKHKNRSKRHRCRRHDRRHCRRARRSRHRGHHRGHHAKGGGGR